MNAITTRATHEYLTRVRTALADIPAPEVDDLLDDVRPHLADIAAEIGEACTLRDMIARLGTPEQYAAELRAAGDYPPAPLEGETKAAKTSGGLRFALWSMLFASFVLLMLGVVALADAEVGAIYAGVVLCGPVIGAGAFVVSRRPAEALTALPEVSWFRGMRDSSTGRYLQSLAPGWWIGAALIFVGSALVLIRNDPWEVATVLLIFAILAGLIVFAGHRVSEHRAWEWATVPLSALAVGCVLGGLEFISEGGPNYNDPMGYQQFANNAPGLHNDGEPVTNIFGFTKDGEPITEFYLVDQNGRPIEVQSFKCDDYGATSDASDNRFPNPVVKVDGEDAGSPMWAPVAEPRYGKCTESNDIPFTVAIPQTTSTTPATTTPAPSESPATSAPEVTTEPVPAP